MDVECDLFFLTDEGSNYLDDRGIVMGIVVDKRGLV